MTCMHNNYIGRWLITVACFIQGLLRQKVTSLYLLLLRLVAKFAMARNRYDAKFVESVQIDP